METYAAIGNHNSRMDNHRYNAMDPTVVVQGVDMIHDMNFPVLMGLCKI